MSPPLVVKFGGDALATPERIAAAAQRVALRARAHAIVAVASARRGVTDHLLGLVEQVREAIPGAGAPGLEARAAADRAVASGELVAASLLAVALGGLGRRAVVLDAREAGLRSTGRSGGAALTVLRPARLERLLVRGVIPVVTGFQGWHRGRLTTLGRGGSDITAVALADTLGAACELVKDPGALHTADPKLLPEARPIARATHRFVTELALAGARVIHPAAAARAEEDGVILRFTSLHGTGDPATEVGPAGAGADARAAVLSNGGELATVTVVSGAPYEAVHRAAEGVAARSGVRVLRTMRRPEATGFVVAPADGGRLLRTLHAALGAALTAGAAGERRYACQG